MDEKKLSGDFTYPLESSFIPTILKERILQPSNKRSAKDHATLLWLDIYHFSPLCKRLMKDTVNGVEKITDILKSHYNFLISNIAEYGGQPLFFVGDGLMSAWIGDKNEAEKSVPLAAACAHHIIKNRNTVDDLGELLSIHSIITLGPWKMARLEGIHGKKILSFYGEVFNDLTLAAKNRAPNQVLIFNDALTYLPRELKSSPLKNKTAILLDSPVDTKKPERVTQNLTEDAFQELRSFTPRTISFPISRERLQWISEIRPVTVLFTRIPNKGKNSSKSLIQLRQTTGLIKPLVLKYDGLLNHVWMDEKQSNILICFGPSPSAHVDNPERCVKLAADIAFSMKKYGFEYGIGVCTGMAYCGILGNDLLRQYTIIGDVVNLSARLAGIKLNTTYCDKATFEATKKVIDYGKPVTKTIKGFAEPLPLYKPEGIVEGEIIKSNLQISIGRDKELEQLLDSFRDALQGKNKVLIVEGGIGMGKSRLLEDFKLQPVLRKGNLLSSSGEYITRDTPYNIWESIFQKLLDIDGIDSGEDKKTKLDKVALRFGYLTCLLNIVLQTDFPETDEVQNLTAAQKIEATRNMLLNILMEETKKRTLAIVINDAQWMDEASWDLIVYINERLNNCLMVLSFQKAKGHVYINTNELNHVEHVRLKPLSNKDLTILICKQLGVTSISDELMALVKKITKGNPFFSLELIGSLQDQDLLVVKDDHCSLIEGSKIDAMSLPETVRSAVRRRIDRLEPGSRLSLKVGSVVGQRFGRKIVHSIFPIELEKPAVKSYLNEAKNSGFLRDSVVDNLKGYLFSNATTAEVAYEMTLAEQRRHLHLKSAEWYENNFKDNLHPFYVRLAHHWENTGNIIKASEYLEKECNKLVSAGFTKQAIELGLKGINLFNIDIDPDPDVVGVMIGTTIQEIGKLMENKTIKSLSELNELEDPETERLIVMLTHIGPYTYVGGRLDIFVLLSVLGLKITLENGNAEATADVYSMYAIVHRGMTGDSRTAFEWSRLAIDIDNRYGGKLHSRVAHVHAWFLNHWVLPISENFPVSRGGIEAGLESGDIMFACFNLAGYIVFMAASGMHLNEVIETGRKHFEINNMRVVNAAFHIILEIQVAKALQGRTKANTVFTDEEFDEKKDVASILDTDFVNQKGFYYIAKLKIHTHFGEWEKALEWAEYIPPIYPAIAHQIGEIEFEMFQAISLLYRASETTGKLCKELLVKADAGIEKIYGWAEVCEYNFLHKAMMLDAIKKGFEGEVDAATEMFEKAAEKARKNGYFNDRALILEHQLRMQHRLGLKKTVLNTTTEAWNEFGAYGKARYIMEQFA